MLPKYIYRYALFDDEYLLNILTKIDVFEPKLKIHEKIYNLLINSNYELPKYVIDFYSGFDTNISYSDLEIEYHVKKIKEFIKKLKIKIIQMSN